jgi:hypothetical protein
LPSPRRTGDDRPSLGAAGTITGTCSAAEGPRETPVERHEALRTTFTEDDGVLYQVVGAPAPVLLPVLDLTGAADAEGWSPRRSYRGRTHAQLTSGDDGTVTRTSIAGDTLAERPGPTLYATEYPDDHSTGWGGA